jgi:hypothetical protein
VSGQHWSDAGELEARLRRALAPIDPPEELELDAWELAAFKDPRNWPRAALGGGAAVLIGSGAAAGLVLLRSRRRRHRRRAQARGALDLAERTLRDVAREALHVFDDVRPR